MNIFAHDFVLTGLVISLVSCGWGQPRINQAEMFARFTGESRVTIVPHEAEWKAREVSSFCWKFCAAESGTDISNLVVDKNQWVEPAEIFRDAVIKELNARFPLLDVHATTVLNRDQKVENISGADSTPYVIELQDSEWMIVHSDGQNWVYYFSRLEVRRETDQTLESFGKCRRTLNWRTRRPKAWDMNDRVDLINRIRRATEECTAEMMEQVFGRKGD